MNIVPTNESIHAVRIMEEAILSLPQIDIDTQHVFHAGCYARTVILPKGCTLTGAQIKIPTLVIISGDVLINGVGRCTGYHVLSGKEGRKNAFHALEETHLTMIFATETSTVEEAEEEFTDETSKLMSRKNKRG